jgi:CRP-like cAMP-binding protein
VTELSQVGLLAALPGELLMKLAGRMQREEIGPGAPIVTEGEDGERFYVVLRHAIRAGVPRSPETR